MRINQTDRRAFLRHNQRNLAARNHAHTDAQGVVSPKAACLRTKPAADNLTQHCDNEQHQREHRNFGVHSIEHGFDAD